MLLRGRGQHPPILADAALLQRDLQGIQAGGDSRQTAGHDPVALAIRDHEPTQHHRARHQPPVFQHRRGRQWQRFLRHKHLWRRLNPADQLGASRRVKASAFPVRLARQDRTHHQLIQMIQHIAARIVIAAPPGRQGRQRQRFAQQLLA